MALQDGGELLHEGVVAQLEAPDLVGIAVVGDHGRDGREQADGGGHQRMSPAVRGKRRLMGEINVVPYIDVMLVLLIIFMITAPLLTHREPVALPVVRQQRNVEGPRTVTLSMHADGRLYWNDVAIARAAALPRLRIEAQRLPPPDLQLRADRDTDYRTLLELLADSKSAGMRKIDLVTTPR